MRTVAGMVILACGLAAESGAQCNPSPVVTITYDENDESKKCDVVSVDPDPVLVCHPNSTISWKFVNDCEDKNLKVKIGNRQSLYPKRAKGDPLVISGDLKPSPEKVAPGASITLQAQRVDPAAKNGRYKYDIAGDIDTDPEIEVRRGDGIAAPPPPTPQPLPTPRPDGR